MTKQTYMWERFWAPKGGRIDLSDGGYLVHPESAAGIMFNPALLSNEQLSQLSCLILLGEPGIGKSHVLESMRSAQEAHDFVHWVDLGSISGETRLVEKVFNHEHTDSWRRSNQHLTLYLDSLDEVLESIPSISKLLLNELAELDIDRLSIRLVSRTAVIPTGMENGLKDLWGENNFGAYELAPLSRENVAEAVEAGVEGNPERFFAEVDRVEAVPFAITPITLKMLINIFNRDGSLPSRKDDLYEQGTLLYCQETESRRFHRPTAIEGEKKLEVASRMAAAMVFGNKYAVYDDIDSGSVPEGSVAIERIAGGQESVGGNSLEVNPDLLRDTLNTGLFSSHGPKLMGFTHRTFAEYLAARYLIRHEFGTDQMLNLLVHPMDPSGSIVPQLRETAAWLAMMNQDVLDAVLQTNPRTLLAADVASIDKAGKERIVAKLLEMHDREGIDQRIWEDFRRYQRLTHPGLTNQLRPYIGRHAQQDAVRIVAIFIAHACELSDLVPDLTEIALDQSEPTEIRKRAAETVMQIGDLPQKASLKPLVIDPGNDPDDALLGIVLQCLWPRNIDAEDLFNKYLNLPKNKHLVGDYHQFLSHHISEGLKVDDIPIALNWVKNQPERYDLPLAINDAMNGIMSKAWDHLENTGVLKAFADVAIVHLQRDYSFSWTSDRNNSDDPINTSQEKRRLLISEIIARSSVDQEHLELLAYSDTPLVNTNDFDWMLEMLTATRSTNEQKGWATLIRSVFTYGDCEHHEKVVSVSQTSKPLYKAFSDLLGAIELDSDRAEQLRKQYRDTQALRSRRQNKPELDPPLDVRIEALLQKFEQGELDAWWQLNCEMTLTPTSTRYQDEREADLTKLPVWNAADERTQKRIVDAAGNFILHGNPRTDEWFGSNKVYRPAYAGFRALLLLEKESPDFFDNIPVVAWKVWTPIVVAFPDYGGSGELKAHLGILKNAYKHARGEFIQSLLAMFDKENNDHGHIFITEKASYCWDDEIANALLSKIRDDALTPESVEKLLRELLQHDVEGAQRFAVSYLQETQSESQSQRRKSVVIAKQLLALRTESSWPLIWSIITHNDDFGRELVEEEARLYNNEEWARIGRILSEIQLADLYIWLVHHYPYRELIEQDDDPHVDQIEMIERFRYAMLGALRSRGTQNACWQLERIIQEFPSLTFLTRNLVLARETTLQKTWAPPSPELIIQIVSNHSLKLVRNADQLFDVVLQSLQRLENDLKGETPASVDLWDTRSDEPKEENDLSDYVKRHLDRDLVGRGIIVGREVRIHRGELTDIHVDGIVASDEDSEFSLAKVIIEVKGCWHPKLNTAMETQLVGRYLKENDCQHGLYLVGWFYCDKWQKPRGPLCNLSKNKNYGIDEARAYFDEQASRCTEEGLIIKALVLNAALSR